MSEKVFGNINIRLRSKQSLLEFLPLIKVNKLLFLDRNT